MAFQMKCNETVVDGIKRNVRRQIEKALAQLRAGDDPDETVHEVRTRLKRIRAALRLVRDDLGDTIYHRENFLFRDAARPLTEVRDARVVVETLDKLTADAAGQINPRDVRAVRKLLVANRKAVTRRVLTEQNGFSIVVEAIEPVLTRLLDWPIHQEGWSALKGGLERVYGAGYLALAAARAKPSAENFHEWRKQAKYLWNGLQLLEPAWIGDQKDLCDQIHNLTRLLGEDHDLAVLSQTLDADPLAYGGHGVLDNLSSRVKRRHEDLEQQALALGQRIYRDTPADFINRIQPAWQTRGSITEKKPQEQAEAS